MAANQMTQLAAFTEIVADTGDFEAIRKLQPKDATTNPSLLLSAATKKEFSSLVDNAVEYGRKHGQNEREILSLAMDRLFVNFGIEILKVIPGLVSTEVDARLSFDVDATVAKARQLVRMYKEAGVDTHRILIKIAATWEGMRAVQILEKEGIRCNVTLLFSLAQAVVAAEAGAFLISPFVGRITDWFKASTGTKDYPAESDPGVLSVRKIYAYYKKRGYKTVIMGASFRSKAQVLALAGCDKLTVSPALLTEMQNSTDPVERHLSAEGKLDDVPTVAHDEKTFRWLLNEDAMATEKLAEGIRKFAADAITLEKAILQKIQSH